MVFRLCWYCQQQNNPLKMYLCKKICYERQKPEGITYNNE